MNRYRKIELLGKGAFGKVYKVSSKTENKICVMKVYYDKKHTDDLEDAAELSMKLKHPNLMKCYTFFFDRIHENKWASSVHLVTILEYVEGVNMEKLSPFTEKEMDRYTPQIVNAIKYLHGKGIVHRDIKPENIMVNGDVIKLIDYDFLIDRMSKLSVNVGTPYYCSPEIFEHKRYSYKTDLWSLGITIYKCLTDKQPFDADNKLELGNLILSSYKPNYEQLGFKYEQICEGLLQKDPSKRISLTDVLSIL